MPPDGRTERREVSHGEESQPHQWRDDTTTTTTYSFVQQEVDQNEKVPAGTAHTAAASPHVQLTHLLYTPSPSITLKI